MSCLPIVLTISTFPSKNDALFTCTMEKQPEHGHLSQMQTAIFNRYCDIVLNHPWKTILTTLASSLILVAIAIGFHYTVFDFDPVKVNEPVLHFVWHFSMNYVNWLTQYVLAYGSLFFKISTGFETRGTVLSNARLTLDAIKKARATPKDILLTKFKKHIAKRQAKTFKVPAVSNSSESDSQKYLEEKPRTAPTPNGTTTEALSTSDYTTTLEPISIDYNDYGTDTEPKAEDLSDPCVQYTALGAKIPFQYIDYAAKIIFEVRAKEVFSANVFRRLCEVDRVIDKILNNSQYRPMNLPFKNSFNLPLYSTCLRFSTANNCDAINVNDTATLQSTLHECRKDPQLPKCETPLIQQVRHYLLPTAMTDGNRYVAAILKIPASDNRQGSFEFYEALLKALQNMFVGDVSLKGSFFNVKNTEFIYALQSDAKIAAVSAVLVLACFLLYSRSFLYTFVIMSIIFLSMGVAFFFYTVILRINFFPSLNLLAFVLMIAVGADDAFLLLVYYRRFRKAKEEPYHIGDPYVPLYKERDRMIRAIRSSLRHSLASMFVTSATTAVAFISNLSSAIIVLRCFGIFASLTMMANFILVVFLLPSTMVLTCSEKRVRLFSNFEMAPQLSRLIYRCRYIVLLLGIITTAIASVIVFIAPGLKMPRYNPTRLLTSSNPYEWFDNNEHLFDFNWKRKFKFMENYVIGVDEKSGIRDASSLSPYVKGDVPFENFHANSTTLEFIKSQRFIPSSCFVEYAADNLPSMFPEDFAVILSDGPIFDKDLNMIGYYVAIPSRRTLSLDSNEVENVAQVIEANCGRTKKESNGLKIMCLSSSDITKYYDIIATLSSTTVFAVAISVVISLVVVILCTRRLMLSVVSVAVITCVILWTTAALILLGWELSVVESTIIVLTIGLSFDFTLHFAVSYRDEIEKEVKVRISSCLSSAGRACLLGAITSVLCGIPLLFANTAAFAQVGSMLLTLGITSLCGATILFPAVLMCMTDISRKRIYSVHF